MARTRWLAFKRLDFDSPYHVFVYRDRDDHQPVCRLNALISADRASFPQRLLTHIACFSNLDDWLHNGVSWIRSSAMTGEMITDLARLQLLVVLM